MERTWDYYYPWVNRYPRVWWIVLETFDTHDVFETEL
jgi:hypothetical protein